MQQPGECHLRRGCSHFIGDGSEDAGGCRVLTAVDRLLWDERQAFALAVGEHVARIGLEEVEAVLHAGDLDDLARRSDLLDSHIRQPNVTNRACFLQLFERADLLWERNRRVDSVQLEEMSALDTKPASTQLCLLAQILRSSDCNPLAATGAGKAGFRRDYKVFRIRVQRFRDEFLVGAEGV